jgi:hypothetical protein
MDGNTDSNARPVRQPAEATAPTEVTIREGTREVEMIILLVIGGIAVCVPIGCAVLVSLASRREDAAHSLAGRPSGAMEAAARRVVGFHGDGIGRRPGDPGAARPGSRTPDVPHLVG